MNVRAKRRLVIDLSRYALISALLCLVYFWLIAFMEGAWGGYYVATPHILALCLMSAMQVLVYAASMAVVTSILQEDVVHIWATMIMLVLVCMYLSDSFYVRAGIDSVYVRVAYGVALAAQGANAWFHARWRCANP